MGLLKDVGPGPVALDTCLFIYFMEENPRYLRLIDPVFTAVAEGRLSAVTSAITLLEVLVHPYRYENTALASRYEELFNRSRNLHLVELDRSLLRMGAQLRAAVRLKTPDALQVAAALSMGCSAFVTHDRGISSLPTLPVLDLEAYLPSAERP